MVYTLLVALFLQGTDGNKLEAELPKPQSWQDGPFCGQNALYCILKMNDIPVDYQVLAKQLNPGSKGNSLEELRQAAKSYGLEAKVLKGNWEDLKNVECPFIALTDTNGLMHHALVVNVAEDHVQIWNAPEKESFQLNSSKFRKSWTGYILAVRTKTLRVTLQAAVVIELVIVSSVIAYPYVWRAIKKFTKGNVTTQVD